MTDLKIAIWSLYRGLLAVHTLFFSQPNQYLAKPGTSALRLVDCARPGLMQHVSASNAHQVSPLDISPPVSAIPSPGAMYLTANRSRLLSASLTSTVLAAKPIAGVLDRAPVHGVS